MPKATVVVAVDNAQEVAAVDAWLEKWEQQLLHVSQNFGCGCCVNIWQVEGPEEAIAELPSKAFAGDQWAH